MIIRIYHKEAPERLNLLITQTNEMHSGAENQRHLCVLERRYFKFMPFADNHFH